MCSVWEEGGLRAAFLRSAFLIVEKGLWETTDPTLLCHYPLVRMKLHARPQSGDKHDRQNHRGDHPSPAAFDLGHL